MNLDLSNKDFCLFLMTQFPFASNDEMEIMLSDYLFENFEMPSNEWFDELTGATDETVPWNGYTYLHHINGHVTFYAAFHPNETIYFFNDIYLGKTGGHFHLSLLSWNELKTIVTNDQTAPSLLFLLLLPLTIGNESERQEIEASISKHLAQTSLNLEKDRSEEITRFLSRHVIFSDDSQNTFEYKEKVGLTTNRNHSERNKKYSDENLVKINEVIKLALQ